MIDPEKPVETPAEFFGQKTVFRRIFSRIGAERPQSVAAIGGIKTGKTSLLNCIAHESSRAEYLERTDNTIFCRLDSGLNLFHDPASFVTALMRQLGAETQEGANHYHALQRSVETSHEQGRKLILLLDDFHLITSNSSFPLEFFSFLRSLANNYNLAYLTTSFLELQKLCVVKDIEESPFFNIFTNLSLGPLSPEEGCALLAALTSREPEEVAGIVSWCGTFPYPLKIVAAALADSGVEPRSLRSLNPEKLFLPLLSPYFEKVLSIMPEEALNPLKSISRDKAVDSREAHVLRPLIKQGFLVEDQEKIAGFAPAFTVFLRKNLSRALLQGKS